MKTEDYKDSLRLLRGIIEDCFDITEEFHLSKEVIEPILGKEAAIEEILTNNFIGE